MAIKPPSWNEIRQEASRFALEYADKTDENAFAQAFWIDFLNIFGVDHKRVRARFEQTAKRESTGGRGRIDMFWPRLLIVEHKSAGKNLEQAEEQALDYLQSIDQEDWPIYVVTSNFHSMRIKSLETSEPSFEFPLTELVKEIDRFGFLAGYDQRSLPLERQAEANGEAARLMGRLYEEVSRNGYSDHEASILLMRLLFLLFGEDTGMWETNLFDEFLRTRTNQDGTDLGPQLTMLFQTLDKPESERSAALDDLIRRFPYVNGGLFKERLDIPTFNKAMRDELLKCCSFHWGEISPAIFGSMFQSIKSAEARRELGEHYTSELNILKVIRPLFLDELEEEFGNSKDQVKKLQSLLVRLGKIRVLDPACGCGNFLIVAYRELRSLELRILVRLRELTGDERLILDATLNSVVRLDHFFGIEIEEWPAEIAEVAMFLVDHQANLELAQEFGMVPTRLPINVAATIVRGNALNLDWNQILPASDDVFILGNPPFIGSTWLSAEQKADQAFVWGGVSGSGVLDYVCNWYLQAAKYMQGTKACAAFVSTNSITQGQQPQTLWGSHGLSQFGIEIDFAYRTFPWASEAPGQAAVHCVIVGISEGGVKRVKSLWSEESKSSNSDRHVADNINAYLIDAPNVLITSRRKAINSASPVIINGSKPTDAGFLSNISTEEAEEIRSKDPIAAKYLRRLVGGEELINNKFRYCLWLEEAEPADMRNSVELKNRIGSVREFREASKDSSTRKDAQTPHLFQAIRQPKTRYLAIPQVSSENRKYIPMRFFDADVISNDKLRNIWGATPYHFGVLSSRVFTVWVESISGRLESRFQLSNEIVLNNLVWPSEDNGHKEAISSAAQEVLDVRERFPASSLADLYSLTSMPKELSDAHSRLDKTVLNSYGLKQSATNSDILTCLIDRYLDALPNEHV
jgi:hypothetical protein